MGMKQKYLFFLENKIFLLHPHENQSKYLGEQGWIEILMITLTLAMRNITLYSVSWEFNQQIYFTLRLTSILRRNTMRKRGPYFCHLAPQLLSRKTEATLEMDGVQ